MGGCGERWSCVLISVRVQSHRALQKAMRKLVDEVIYPDAQAREEQTHKPIERRASEEQEQDIAPQQIPDQHESRKP